MKNSQLNIPKKIKVGYQNRDDTFTKKLAYVIYFDEKGVLRKEKSWEGWRDKKIDPQEFDNVPTEGFVLNKKVGGHKSDWNYRSSYIRIYDPRGFEFEITVENLLFILSVCDCSRGKGLEGKFVYSWHGTDLVLLPTECEEYKNSQDFTSLKTMKVASKDLILGASYKFKDQSVGIYLCRAGINNGNTNTTKQYVFWRNNRLDFHKDVKNVACVVNPEPASNYADLLDNFNKSKYAAKAVKILLEPFIDTDTWSSYRASFTTYNGHPCLIHYHEPYYKNEAIRVYDSYWFEVKDGVLLRHKITDIVELSKEDIKTTNKMLVEFEGGKKYKYVWNDLNDLPEGEENGEEE